uniref:NADH-ubiquinone oxidoreductase chain 4L n=1 Tax=Euhadra brandtii sapporo TaxID=244841 RepID=Q75YP8_9EUPU|nr:NADH dehydrogenase subunit 4L [Euhadra brandtii sapporo]
MNISYFHTYIVLFCILWSVMLISKKSVLMCLISLEFLHFFLFLIFYSWTPPLMNSYTIVVLLLCFAASGAAMGLCILVTMGRQSGSDLIVAARV